LRFHLDALMDPNAVNLSGCFVGHGGALGWLVAATFMRRDTPLPPTPIAGAGCTSAWVEVDQAIKRVIDPDQVFLSLPEQTE
jgi:hypothetical protein